MISEVRKIYMQDRIIGISVAHRTRITFGLTHYLVFLKTCNSLYQAGTLITVTVITVTSKENYSMFISTFN